MSGQVNPPNGTILCILYAGSHEYARKPAGALWCFGCRRRLPHDWVLTGDPPEEMSYYEPTWSRRCMGCGDDRTTFPGCSIDYWGDY